MERSPARWQSRERRTHRRLGQALEREGRPCRRHRTAQRALGDHERWLRPGRLRLTAQGFEYDWSGVIIGPDLAARHGRTITVREVNKDPEFKKRSVADLQYDRHIRNIYKVLLTRGMVGTVIYAVDPHTQDFLAELIERPAGIMIAGRWQQTRPAEPVKG